MHRGMPHASRLGLGNSSKRQHEGKMYMRYRKDAGHAWAVNCHVKVKGVEHIRCTCEMQQQGKGAGAYEYDKHNSQRCSLHLSCHRMHCQHHRRPGLHSLVCQTCILFLSCATYLSVQAATSYSNGTYVMYTAVSACACCAARAGLSFVCSPAFWMFLSPPLLSSRMHSSLELLERSCPQCLACTCIHV